MSNDSTPAAREAFAKALREYATTQPNAGNDKIIADSEGSYSLNDIADEIATGTEYGLQMYVELKDVVGPKLGISP